MFKVTKRDANRVDIEISGTLDSDEMAKALDELMDLAQDVRNGKMLYTITDFAMPTLGAIGVEIARLPKLFTLIGKFDKCAILSDTNWIRQAAEIEGAVFPGLTIKSFEMDQLEVADAWLGARS